MKALRAKGHKLTMTWSGEYGVESSSTGTCPCGWQESASNQTVVRFEYRQHLLSVKNKPFVPFANDCGSCHGRPLDEVALCRDCNGTGEHHE
jgi:DnaJ-class molecular chaperone